MVCGVFFDRVRVVGVRIHRKEEVSDTKLTESGYCGSVGRTWIRWSKCRSERTVKKGGPCELEEEDGVGVKERS